MLDIKRALDSARVPERAETFELSTPWGERLAKASDGAVLPEHPRPAMVRDAFTMLNGTWEYAIVPAEGANGALSRTEALDLVARAREPRAFDGEIRVPFSPEAPLSGVRRTLTPRELLWYRRTLDLPAPEEHKRIILHFEAVDWACAVFVDGRLAATHVGGYLPFDVDVTSQLAGRSEGGTELAVCVYDPSDAGNQPRGKQRLKPGGIWYSAQSGIWQSVWLETVPCAYLTRLALVGDARGHLEVEAELRLAGDSLPPDAGYRLELSVIDRAGLLAARASLPFGAEASSAPLPATSQLGGLSGTPGTFRRLRATVELDRCRPWSPEDPYLYRAEAVVRTGADGAAGDRVLSYAAFRTVEVRRDAHGTPRVFLNGEPHFLRGVLDQGYWPDGLMTAPSDEALASDIAAMREAGFTMLRKHLKIECARWYYHCDRLGMLVWQDAVSGGGPYSPWHTSRKPTVFKGTWGRYRDDIPHHRAALASDDAAYQLEWTATAADMVRLLAGHPSIIAWSLFNEAYGQFDARAAAELVHTIDPTRPIDAVSGWYDQHCGDFLSHHNYFRPLTVGRDRGRLSGYARGRGFRAFVLSEFGGWSQPVEDHRFSPVAYGYGDFPALDDWRGAVRASLAAADALEARGLAGYVYTQLSDVEDETNGILTYDRRVNKLVDGA